MRHDDDTRRDRVERDTRNDSPVHDARADGPTFSRTARGRLAESLVAAYLEFQGFEVLDRNVRDGPRELDLVARVPRALRVPGAAGGPAPDTTTAPGWAVVIEVRYRASVLHGRPDETVRFKKQRDLVRAGRAWWLARGHEFGPLRFDLVSLIRVEGGVDLRHRPHFLDPRAERYFRAGRG